MTTRLIGLAAAVHLCGQPPADKAFGAKAETGVDLESLPSLFSVFAGLGLKLEPQKAPVEMLMIEHVGKPSPN